MKTLEMAECVALVRAGGVVVCPTETFYGLAADARDRAAVERIFAIKHRPAGKPLPVMLGDVSQLDEVVDGDAQRPRGLARLADAFWPGPLTVVLPAADVLAPGATQPGPHGPCVALRVSGHPVARKLSLLCGAPLVATSANVAGGQPVAEAHALDANIVDMADGVLAGEGGRGGAPSTIVRLTGEMQLDVLRAGAIGVNVLREAGFAVGAVSGEKS